jgi:hypothetical protein
MSAPDKRAVLTLPAFAHRMRKVAEKVRGIGYGKASRSPEAAMIQKDEIAAEIEKLAAVLEGSPD